MSTPNPRLLDHGTKGGPFLLYDYDYREYQVVTNMMPWLYGGYLFRSPDRVAALAFFKGCFANPQTPTPDGPLAPAASPLIPR